MRSFAELASTTAKAALLSIIPNISLAMAATSDDLFNSYFGNVLGGLPCFARSYDDDHLEAHPGQRVRSIAINLSKANSDGTPNIPDHFAVSFAVMLTSGGDWFGQAASCKTNETDFECSIDGDGGIFTLTPQKGGGLRLDAGDEGITIDSADPEITLSDKDGEDDRAFELVPSKDECKAAKAFFESGND
jgi:hypothetical protein